MERKWEELQMDCLVNVFEKLEFQDLILGVPFVCKSWYKASLSPQCWKSVDLSKLIFCRWNTHFSERFKHEYRIQNFSVTGLTKMALNRGGTSVVELILPGTCTLDDLIYASNKCPCLKILGLPWLLAHQEHYSFETTLNDEEIKQYLGLITIWKDLEYLHIGEKQPYTEAILFEISHHCKNFVGLKKAGSMDDDETLAIAKFFPRLKHLSVNSGHMSRKQMEMILKGCKELEDLVLKDCWGFEVDEEILKMTSHINSFECEDLRLFYAEEPFYDSELELMEKVFLDDMLEDCEEHP